MKYFETLLSAILKDPKNVRLNIKGNNKKTKGIGRYTSVNYFPEEYIKIAFEDNSFLLLLTTQKELYYSDEYIINVESIKDEDIGFKEIIEYKGKQYKLGNKDDYQYTLVLYKGTINDIEGEVKFSDYFPLIGEKEFLSVGWLMKTGKRADVNPKMIELHDVKVLDK